MNDLSATDRCVKCGLCLPHCPTFTLTGNEADSPRGRISLMQAMDHPQLQDAPGLFRHLDQCLQCGACETMCPSRVPFTRLMDTARARIEPRRKRSAWSRIVRNTGLWLIASPQRMKILGLALRSYQRFGLQKLLTPALPASLKRLNRTFPDIRNEPLQWGQSRLIQTGSIDSGPIEKSIGAANVNLFRGCTGDIFDRITLASTKRLLEKLGYRVRIPEQQTCCGALHQHNGEPRTAGILAATNRQAFSSNSDPILVSASGCAVQLLTDSSLSERISDILDFLLQHNRSDLKLEPFEDNVAIHIPCSYRNVLRQQGTLLEILGLIPGLEPLLINPQGGCCGAAGSYMLSQPELSDRLRQPLIEKLIERDTKILLTTNIGCSLHLQAGIRARGAEIQVWHPVVLLDRLMTAGRRDQTGQLSSTKGI